MSVYKNNVGAAKRLGAVLVVGLLACGPSAVNAQNQAAASVTPLSHFLEPLLKTDRRLAAAAEDMEASNQRAKAAAGDWFPTVKLTNWAGEERIENPAGGGVTNMNARQTDLTLTQLVTDFGKTDSKVMRARIAAQQGEVGYQLIKQTLINDAASAYANLYRSGVQLRYALESEANLGKQFNLEQERFKAGGGVATDVLQVQAQLSGAQARRFRAQVQVQNASSRFFNLFGVAIRDMATLISPAFPSSLPTSLEDALKQAPESNLSIKNAMLSSESARESIRAERAESYYPKVEVIYDNKNKDNVLGTAGVKKEQLLKAQLTWSFNLGGAGINTVKAAEHALTATEHRRTDTEKNAGEQVAIAWNTLMASRQTAAVYVDQVAALSKFLDLARKERTLGSRSLLDVLNGETALLNAQSDAISSEIDVLLSGYAVLQSLGQLTDAAVLRVQ